MFRGAVVVESVVDTDCTSEVFGSTDDVNKLLSLTFRFILRDIDVVKPESGALESKNCCSRFSI